MENKEKKIGEFRVNSKFVKFIGNKDRLIYEDKEALIRGNQLSGLGIDNLIFKLVICDDKTVDFTEVDTNETTTEQRKRLLDIIDEKKPNTSAYYKADESPVITDIEFTPVVKPNMDDYFKNISKTLVVSQSYQDYFENITKDLVLNLSVEVIRPIDKLFSIFEDEEDSHVKIDKGDSLFDQLFGDEFDEIDNIEDLPSDEFEEVDEVNPINIIDNVSFIEESFEKMKKDKEQEIRNRIDEQNKEVKRLNMEKTHVESKLSEINSSISLLEDRLYSITPCDEPNGYYFFVSEEKNKSASLDDETLLIIAKKVSKLKSINLDRFMSLFKDGEYIISIGIKGDDGVVVETDDVKSMPESVFNYLSSLNLTSGDGKNFYIQSLVHGLLNYIL